MSEKLTKKSVAHNYAFRAIMLVSMILGSIVGAIFPQVKEGDEVVKMCIRDRLSSAQIEIVHRAVFIGEPDAYAQHGQQIHGNGQ